MPKRRNWTLEDIQTLERTWRQSEELTQTRREQEIRTLLPIYSRKAIHQMCKHLSLILPRPVAQPKGSPCSWCRDRIARKRGLCLVCALDKAILAGAPKPTYRSGASEIGVNQATELDESPCPHPPGSLGKIERLIERAERGVLLWHPDDATHESMSEVVRNSERPNTTEEADEAID